MADISPTIGLAEVEQKQADRLFRQYCVGEHRGTLLGRVDQQRPVVTVILLPGLDGLVVTRLLPRCILAMSSGG